ncbi:hypothetical protein NX784_10590 [Massilia pinisoli]|uniref:HTH cro/C1-type domain-containing protein n=1 Tax=Massilia pinisoli TaxID=1772194 RepID=A0ABT1ZQ58_9BURK|nr:hypothetical protein [Massilia pinisoli]MCS0582038.1 hypothetical protein [Massilia pinisoli]
MDRVKALDERLRELVDANAKRTRRNADLEELTRIPASAWASWWAGRARPSAEMLSAVCSIWPEYSLWLMTGATDRVGGQISPSTQEEQRQETTKRYLRRLTELTTLKIGWRQEGGGGDFSDWEIEELGALEKIRSNDLKRRLQNVD